jgi:hypothetical protein
MLAFTV